MSAFRILTLIALLIPAPGCLSSELSNPPLPPKIFELAAANRRPLHVRVKLAEPGHSLGHQYLLIAIPFGRVRSDNVELIVERALYRSLSLRGYTPLLDQEPSAAPVLSVQLVEPQASAFDLLLTRHLSCSLELKGQFLSEDKQRDGTGRGGYEQFAAFAFEREMSLCFTQALDIAIDRLLNDLRI